MKQFVVPEETLQKTLNYLASRPYAEVNGLFNLIQSSSREIKIAPQTSTEEANKRELEAIEPPTTE